jgi:hypothetical protein
MIPHTVIPGWECPYVIFPSISAFLYLFINNCVHIMFKIWYMTIILSYLILCSVLMMRGSFKRKCCRDTIITLRAEIFSQEMHKTLHKYFTWKPVFRMHDILT